MPGITERNFLFFYYFYYSPSYIVKVKKQKRWSEFKKQISTAC